MQRVDTVQMLAQSLLTGSVTTIYTATADGPTIISGIWMFNNDTSERTINLYLVPNGGSANDTTRLIAKSIAYQQAFIIEKLPIVVNAGDTIQAGADVTNKVNCMIFGTELIDE